MTKRQYFTLFSAEVFSLLLFFSVSSFAEEWVYIPASEVQLGSDAKEKAFAYSLDGETARRWRMFDSERKRKVFLDDYCIDAYPVTQEEYARFVQATGHRVPFITEEEYRRQGFLVHTYQEVIPYLWKDGKPPQDKLRHPVVLVSLGDAWEYCHWRDKSDAKHYVHVPAEDEWEKAARGSDGRYFPWGNEWDRSKVNVWGSGPGGTTPVSLHPAGISPYGVYEMAGNIFEWTMTPWKEGSGRYVLKSCSWDDAPGLCRGAARHARPSESRHILIGFRCAETPLK